MKKIPELTQHSAHFKYSKSSEFYLDTKSDFFAKNDQHLAKSLDQNNFYSKQPKRLKCKLCLSALSDKADFFQHGVEYIFCDECGHLNGRYEDSKSFIEKLYSSDKGAEYATNYLDDDYKKRANDIYLPKVEFLTANIPSREYELLDVGCGNGCFVYAAIQKGIEAYGIDIGQTLVEFGNDHIFRLLKKRPLSSSGEDDFYRAIKQSGADIISAIGVIEHLREPHRFFEAFRESRAQYLYYSVPMFSLSVVLENIFDNVFPRQLSGGHTHLFTEQSLPKMNALIGVRSIAEWRFGTDMMDLYRGCITTLSKKKASEKLLAHIRNGLGEKIDELQSILDRHHFCSEIHCVTAKV